MHRDVGRSGFGREKAIIILPPPPLSLLSTAGLSGNLRSVDVYKIHDCIQDPGFTSHGKAAWRKRGMGHGSHTKNVEIELMI